MARALGLVGLVCLALPTVADAYREGRSKRSQANLTVASVSAEADLNFADGQGTDTEADYLSNLGQVLLTESMVSPSSEVTVKVLKGYPIVNQNYLKNCYDVGNKDGDEPEYKCASHEESGESTHACWAATRGAAKVWACPKSQMTKSACFYAAKSYSANGCKGGGYQWTGMPSKMKIAFPGSFTAGTQSFYEEVVNAIKDDTAIILSMGKSKGSKDERCSTGGIQHFVTIVGYVEKGLTDPSVVVYDPWNSVKEYTGTFKTTSNSSVNVKKTSGTNPRIVKDHPNIVTVPIVNRDKRIHIGEYWEEPETMEGKQILPFAKNSACVREAVMAKQSTTAC